MTGVFLLLLIAQAATPVWAGSKLINVQGKLTDSMGNPLSGSQTVTFRLYNNLTAPVASAIWTESQGITPLSGLFNVALGSVNSLASIPFNTPYYLGMQVAGDSNELSPRQLLGASAYSLGSLSDFSVGQNLIVSSSAVVSGSITSNGMVGTQTNDNANVGNIGERVVAFANGVYAAGNGVMQDVASIMLTPGDWDVSANGTELFMGGGTYTEWDIGISVSQGNTWSGLTTGDNVAGASGSSSANNSSIAIPTYRMSLSSTTTVYLKFISTYSGNAPRLYGRISARRVR